MNIKKSFAASCLVLISCVAVCFASSLQSFHLFDFRIDQIQRIPQSKRVLAIGDYSETPETCPFTTTCPDICVAEEQDCPTSCADGLTLCNDGTCSTSCDPGLESPCSCEGLNFTCAKVIDTYPSCQSSFINYYNATAECLAAEAENLKQVSFTGPAFLFCYCWISGVSVLVVVFCFFNQKVAPNPASVQTLTPVSHEGDSWKQIGYKKNIVGGLIGWMVWITLWGIQALLLILTILYYIEEEAITRWNKVFYDPLQSLKAFELTWVVGLLWSFVFQWPYSIESLFLRRCTLDRATHVAVETRIKKVEVIATENKVRYGEMLANIIWYPFDLFFRVLFSYPRSDPSTEIVFCKVSKSSHGVKSFYCLMGRYVFDETEGKYVPGKMQVGRTIGDFLNSTGGLTTDQANANLQLVGSNIIQIAKPTIMKSILKEFSKSFYIYQNFMVWTWFPFWNYVLALIQTAVRVVAGLTVATFQHISDSVLYKLSQVDGSVEVVRDGAKVPIHVQDIVPGDIVLLRPGVVFCDMVVVKADHLMVDESALTGESNPVSKIELDSALSKVEYDSVRHKHNTIFAGTEIIETSEDESDLGLVISTGSFTRKGMLLTDILSYRRAQFLFDDEIKIVLMLLVLQALVYITLVLQWQASQFAYAFFYAAYIAGTVIPPLLPTVFVVSVGISSNRLQTKRITCTNPEGILIAGKVNVCCFDKTGTITEAGMEFIGIYSDDDEEKKKQVSIGMAVCHSLKTSAAGELIGNSVDRASFSSSMGRIKSLKGKQLVIEHDGKQYIILKQFEFDNHRQTQSCIVEAEDGSRSIFTKGSPEAICKLCKTETIPETFEETQRTAAKSGIYQLAVARKDYDLNENVSLVTRDDAEKSLTFCGCILFKNSLKKETPEIFRKLSEGNVLVTIITGDSVLTGITIARESGMCKNEKILLGQIGVDSSIEWINVDTDLLENAPSEDTKNIDLAITGEAFRLLLTNDPKYAQKIAKHVRVFGRCNPTDKVHAVNTLVQMGFITLMCGDGQNDCGALKSAHVGIALSKSDASIVAPFTSLDLEVGSVIDVLLEGRCALSSALKAYTYYMMYGQVESYLQTINAYLFVTFAEWCWAFMDAIWSISMAFSLPLAHAATKLSTCRPTASLFGPRTMFSLCGMLVINFFFVVMGLVALNQQSWYQCRKWGSTDVSSVTTIGDNYESSVLFVIGGFQYIITGIALNFGYKFRAAWYTNYIFLFFSSTWFIFHMIMTLYPSTFSCIWRVNCDNENVTVGVTTHYKLPINNAWNTTVMPMEFRGILVAMMLSNLICLCAWEFFFVNGYLYKVSKFGYDDPLGLLENGMSLPTTNGKDSSQTSRTSRASSDDPKKEPFLTVSSNLPMP